MKLSRLIVASIFAAITTAVLIVVMFKLVDKDWDEPDDKKQIKLSAFNEPPADIETQYDTTKPDKPEEVESPPDVPEPEFDAPDVSAEAVNIAQPTLDGNVDVAIGSFSSDGEYLPIVRVEPIYPTRAASRGIEGWAVVEFTVTSNGSVRDPVVVSSEPANIWNRAVQRAVLKWKFKPRVVDGTPVEVPGVQTKLTFNLAK
ncbi:MAG: energy transducer TonB [Cellvibrionaceae bacterium]